MTPRLQNADCRVQAPRGSVGGGWGVPTWPLTLETLWCQKSDADRGGNPDRRQSQDGNITSTTDNGAKVIRPAAGRKPVFSQQGGPRPRQPHKLVEGGFDSRPCSHSFGASDSPGLFVFISPGTVCAALTSSTPSVSCGGFIPGLSARVVVWFRIGVEVSLSVVVPAGPFGGVRDVTTDAPGVGPSTDAGRLLFRGPLGERPGKATREGLDMPTFPVTGGENPSTPANFHGSRPWLKRTWPKSRTNERSRKCRECRQPQPSQCNLESRSPKSLTIGNRNIRGMFSKTAIRSSFLASHGNFLEQLPQLLVSVMASSLEARIVSKTAFPVVVCGVWRVGESTGLPRRKVWGALSVHMEHKGQRSLGLCWRDRQGRSVTRLPAILKNKTEVGQVWTGAPTVGPGNRGADAIESLSANQGSRSERNASDVSDAYWVRTGRNADEKHDLFLCRGVV